MFKPLDASVKADYLSGDPVRVNRALTEMFTRWNKTLLSFLKGRLPRSVDTENIAQEIWLGLTALSPEIKARYSSLLKCLWYVIDKMYQRFWVHDTKERENQRKYLAQMLLSGEMPVDFPWGNCRELLFGEFNRPTLIFEKGKFRCAGAGGVVEKEEAERKQARIEKRRAVVRKAVSKWRAAHPEEARERVRRYYLNKKAKGAQNESED